MKKKSSVIIFTILTFLILINPVNAENLCADTGVQRSLLLVGVAVMVIKIAAPILLIIMGTMGLTKAVAGSDQDALKKNIQIFVKQAIAAVAIFLAPGIVVGLFEILLPGEFSTEDAKYGTCIKCVLDVNDSVCKNVKRYGE